jgi:hypothetical protein
VLVLIVPLMIVPYVASGPLSGKLLKNGTLKTYNDFPHSMPTTETNTINSDLLVFFKLRGYCLVCRARFVATVVTSQSLMR